METGHTAKGEPNRKRPCKGIRACWECKKRKIHGNLNSPGGASSTGTMSTRNAEYGDDEVSPCPVHFGDRLVKLEQLFEKFVCRKFASSSAGSDVRSPSLPDSTLEKSRGFVGGLPEISSDTQSITSIGEGILATQLSGWSSAPSIRTLVDSTDSGSGPASDALRKPLVALLPSQRDADVIFESTNGWMVLTSLYRPAKNLFVNQDPLSYALDMSAIAKEHPVVIARTLLHLAICIHTLPPTFETTRLSNIWSLDAAMENYVATVTSLITSSDEQMSTLPGLETLQLLAAYHLNSGNLRQSWLVIRRAMNLAHLMGFHRIITQPDPNSPAETIEAAKFTWRTFVDADRYLGLHLRLPFASEEYPCPGNAHPALMHRCKLASISQSISELDREVTSQTYVQALALDEKLEGYMKDMSKDFWDVPNVPSTARSPESAEVIERLIVQIWHFELKIFVHLPFLLRAPQETRYEYSKITALQASRNVILRWFALRNSGITQACCRVAELGVFIATVTMTLNILTEMATKSKIEVQKTRGGDFAMVCRVIGELEKLAKSSTREKIASHSATVIKRLLSSLDPSRRTLGKARLTIPYFGSIDIGFHTPPVRPPFDLDSDAGKKLNSNATGSHLPVFSFVSNALWPSTDRGGEGLDFDIILFDGLEDRDTDGNWVF